MAEQLNEEENKCSRTEIDMTEEGMNHEGSKELNSVSFTFSAHRTSGLKKKCTCVSGNQTDPIFLMGRWRGGKSRILGFSTLVLINCN